MAINLKQIFTTDSDNIKLDKVNYNFDQLVANGGGPQGAQGPTGDTGPQGITGSQGFQGLVGPQGDQGPQGSNGGQYWESIQGNISGGTFDTLYPIHDPAITLAPNVVLGYISSDSEYAQPHEDAVLLLHRKVEFLSNLRFINEDSLNAFDWIHETSGGSTVVTARFNNIESNKYIQLADEFIFKDGATELLKLNSDSLTLNVDTLFENNVEILGTLKIASGTPDTDKVAIAADNEGTVEWKSVDELGGTAPVGTIVSILPSIFEDNAKFVNQETYTISDPDTDLLQVKVGSGVGDYVGWYLCNGQTWKNGTGTSIEVPDLNSFSYTIADNTDSIDVNSQGLAQVTNDEHNLLGGADTEMNASYSSSTYTITSTVTTTDVNIAEGSGQTFIIKRLPQIIYLGESDLYWEDAGGDQSPDIEIDYLFEDNASTNAVEDVSGTHTDNAGTNGSFTVTLTAPTGYYWNTAPAITAPSGYNATTSLGSGSEPTTVQVTVTYTSHPGSPSSLLFTYDSSSSLLQVPTTTIEITQAPLQAIGNASITSFSIADTYTQQPGSSSTFNNNTIVLEADTNYEFDGTPPQISALDGTDISFSYVVSGANNEIMTINFNTNNWPSSNESYALSISVSAVSVYNITVGSQLNSAPASQWEVTWQNEGEDPALTQSLSANAGSDGQIGFYNKSSNDTVVVRALKTDNAGFAEDAGSIMFVSDGNTDATYTFNMGDNLSNGVLGLNAYQFTNVQEGDNLQVIISEG